MTSFGLPVSGLMLWAGGGEPWGVRRRGEGGGWLLGCWDVARRGRMKREGQEVRYTAVAPGLRSAGEIRSGLGLAEAGVEVYCGDDEGP
jgi:hypothetical protein